MGKYSLPGDAFQQQSGQLRKQLRLCVPRCRAKPDPLVCTADSQHARRDKEQEGSGGVEMGGVRLGSYIQAFGPTAVADARLQSGLAELGGAVGDPRARLEN